MVSEGTPGSERQVVRTNLLNTRTTNFLELVGNGRIFRVPPYQRDYSWSEEQWEDLWTDVVDLRGDRAQRHYMGALVVEGTTDREFSIIDGQQRLATLSIFALAIIDRLQRLPVTDVEADRNRERAAALRSRFIGEKDPASLIETSKLFLNHTDDPFYQDYLVQLRPARNPRGLPGSNRRLWECFQYYSKQLAADSTLGDGARLAELLAETIGRQLMFILITVDDELNAYTVFETLNARGLELSATDLLKNFLFSRVKVTSDLEALQRRWLALIATVQQERFPEFLRYHMQTLYPQVRSARLFKLVRDNVKTPEDVFGLMESLEERAELFAALSDPNHAYWIESPDGKPYVRELSLFRVRQMTPLLFAAWEKLSRSDFVSVLRIVSVVSFRYSVVSGLNPNALEPAYYGASRAVLDGIATQPAQIFERLQSIYVDDAKLGQDMARFSIETHGQRKRLAKYILARLEGDASGRSCDPDTDPGSIEHILPENPSETWEDMFPRSQWDSAVYRLGNLSLLEAPLNRRVGNDGYAAKVETYATSRYALTRTIPELAPDEWTPALLDERQRRQAGRAVHLWRVDYA